MKGFRAGLGWCWGMDWALVIVGLVIFDILLGVFMVRMLVITLRLELEDLDSKIGQALKALIEQGIGDFEPPNPVQMALAELLSSKIGGMGASAPIQEIVRDPGGKFTT